MSARGDVLVVSKHADLPGVCMKCGTQENIVRRDAKLSWTPTWARLSVVLCTIGGLVAIAITTKRARLALPLCAVCNARWSSAIAATVGGIVALVAGIFSFTLFDDPGIGAVIAFVGFGAFLGLMLAFVRPRILQVHKIDDHVVELKGVHPVACRVLASA